MTIYSERNVHLIVFYKEEDLARFPWLTEKGFTIIMPTFEGYGYAFNPTENLWHHIDITNKIIEKETHCKIPASTFQSFAVNETDWDSNCSKIPVFVNTPALKGN